MTDFVHLISSTNPIEIDQIKIALSQENIETRVKGENALLAGNLELTGISGVSIEVPSERFIHAKSVLQNIGYNFRQNGQEDNFMKYALIGLGSVALVVIIYMIYLAFS